MWNISMVLNCTCRIISPRGCVTPRCLPSTFALAFHGHEHHSFIHKLISHETCFWNIATYRYVHVLFPLWNVKCAILKCNMCHSLSETKLVNTMQQDHETCETWLWNKCNNSCVFHCFSAYHAWFLCDQCGVWLIILLRTLVILRMSFGTLFMLIILPN